MELITRLTGIFGLALLAAGVVAAAFVAIKFWWLVIAIALAIVLARVLTSGDVAR
jgi:hypothetical protein